MKEVSVILKNNLTISTEEFRALDRYSSNGKIWSLTYAPSPISPCKVRYRAIEYIFDPEALIIFYVISRNILVTWDTDITKNFGPNDELQIKDSLFIRLYNKTID